MWQSQQGTANAGHPWNVWKSSQKQGWKEVASLPRPLVFCSHTDSAGVWKPHLSGMAGNLCAHSLAVGWVVGSLPTAEHALGDSALPQAKRGFGWGRDSSSSNADFCRLSPFPKFCLLIGECWSCLAGRCGSLEPGEGKVGLSCWAVSCGCCSLAGLSLEGFPEHSPMPGLGINTRHTTLQPCSCWLCLQGSAGSRQESSPLSCGSFRSYSWFLLRGVV